MYNIGNKRIVDVWYWDFRKSLQLRTTSQEPFTDNSYKLTRNSERAYNNSGVFKTDRASNSMHLSRRHEGEKTSFSFCETRGMDIYFYAAKIEKYAWISFFGFGILGGTAFILLGLGIPSIVTDHNLLHIGPLYGRIIVVSAGGVAGAVFSVSMALLLLTPYGKRGRAQAKAELAEDGRGPCWGLFCMKQKLA